MMNKFEKKVIINHIAKELRLVNIHWYLTDEELKDVKVENDNDSYLVIKLNHLTGMFIGDQYLFFDRAKIRMDENGIVIFRFYRDSYDLCLRIRVVGANLHNVRLSYYDSKNVEYFRHKEQYDQF